MKPVLPRAYNLKERSSNKTLVCFVYYSGHMGKKYKIMIYDQINYSILLHCKRNIYHRLPFALSFSIVARVKFFFNPCVYEPSHPTHRTMYDFSLAADIIFAESIL